ncbi:MAG: hypothetical protein HY216_06550, partial [Candidatus Rokubacteria bacterium]|nr:hypothetical protein [Candidatus Rokubacteria bacterium]
MVYDGGDRGHIHGGEIHLEHRAVMYGGRLAMGALTDSVWTLWIDASGDSVDWRQPTLTLPYGSAGARAKHGAVRSSAWIVTLGGERSNNSAPDTVWALDLTDPLTSSPDYDSLTWRPMQPNPAPRTDVPAFVLSGPLYPRTTEVFSPATATWDTIAGASLPTFWYPYLFPLPNGTLFDAGASLETYRLNDLSGSAWEKYPTTSSSLYGGSAVMYRAGKVMKCGTRDTETGAVAVRTTQRIDLNESSPSWTTDAQMGESRVYHNLTLLPSGEVLATSGTGQSNPNVIINARLRPELWRPDTVGAGGVWYGDSTSSVPLAIEPLSRSYHASALLLPDGRVLTGGGNTGVSGGVDSSAMVSIYCPPYLFKADGSRATRPRIVAAHRVVGYGQTFYIAVDTLETIDR